MEYITASTPLAAFVSLSPVDRPATKGRILVPFHVLPVLPYEHVLCSKLPHHVSVYFFAFPACAYEQALGCSKNNCWNSGPLPHVFFNFYLRTGLMLPKLFGILVRSHILSALPYDKDLRCPNGWICPYIRPPPFFCISVRTESMLIKLVRTWARLPTLLAFVTRIGSMLAKHS